MARLPIGGSDSDDLYGDTLGRRPFAPQAEQWRSDPEYMGLPDKERALIHRNFFDQNMTDAVFDTLPADEQNRIRDNYVRHQLNGDAFSTLEKPSHLTKEEQEVEDFWSSVEAPSHEPASAPPPTPWEQIKEQFTPPDLVDTAKGFYRTAENIGQVYPVAENLAAWASNTYALPAATVAGAGSLLANKGDFNKALETGQAVHGALAYHPQTERGKELGEAIAYPFQKALDIAAPVGELAFQATGSPGVATTVYTAIGGAPAIAMTLAGLHKSMAPRYQAAKWDKAAKPVRAAVAQKIETLFGLDKKTAENIAARAVKMGRTKKNGLDMDIVIDHIEGIIQEDPAVYAQAARTLASRARAAGPGAGPEAAGAAGTARPAPRGPQPGQPGAGGAHLPDQPWNFRMAGEHARYSPEVAARLWAAAEAGKLALPPGQGFEMKPKTIRRPGAYEAPPVQMTRGSELPMPAVYLLTAKGTPFPTEKGAKSVQKLKARQGIETQVEKIPGGWGLRRVEALAPQTVQPESTPLPGNPPRSVRSGGEMMESTPPTVPEQQVRPTGEARPVQAQPEPVKSPEVAPAPPEKPVAAATVEPPRPITPTVEDQPTGSLKPQQEASLERFRSDLDRKGAAWIPSSLNASERVSYRIVPSDVDEGYYMVERTNEKGMRNPYTAPWNMEQARAAAAKLARYEMERGDGARPPHPDNLPDTAMATTEPTPAVEGAAETPVAEVPDLTVIGGRRILPFNDDLWYIVHRDRDGGFKVTIGSKATTLGGEVHGHGDTAEAAYRRAVAQLKPDLRPKPVPPATAEAPVKNPARPKTDERGPKADQPAPSAHPDRIGTNLDGKEVRQDANGVRSYVDGRFVIDSPVEMVPTEAGYTGKGKSPRQLYEAGEWNFLTKEELDHFNSQPREGESATPPQSSPEQADSPSGRLAKWVSSRLDQGFTWRELFKEADGAFGGTQAQGTYSPVDAYDAMEVGINQRVLALGHDPNAPMSDAVRTAQGLKSLVEKAPTQTKRTKEKDELQQFSTPPALSYVAARVANISKDDVVLEPSAGTGNLVTMAKLAGAKTVANELSPRRAQLLALMNPDRIFTENAEQLHNILPPDVKPTVVLMNPPFSSTAGRLQGKGKNRGTNVIKHLDQALARLEPGGRLVAIVGSGMAEGRPAFRGWWDKTKQNYNVRANVGINGEEYRKYGTTFDNQIIVIDKAGKTGDNIITGNVEKIEDLIPLLEEVRNARQTLSPGRTVQQGPAATAGVEQTPGEPGGQAVPDVTGGKGSPRPTSRPATDEIRPGSRDSESGLPAEPGRDNTGNAGNHDVSNGAPERGTVPGAEVNAAPDAQGGESGGVPVRRPGQPDVRDGAGLPETPDGRIEVEQNVSPSSKAPEELSDSIFDAYTPKVKIAGARPHPTKLVQSAAMAATDPPAPRYAPSLPEKTISKGLVSDAQLEAVVYAGQAHETILPNGERKGYFIGDGTGVGKGREIAAIILDNWNKGRKKAVWISEKSALFKDAARDLGGIGWQDGAEKLFELGKTKLGETVRTKSGILFTTYDTLRKNFNDIRMDKPSTLENMRVRVNQLAEWFGKDYDGVIVFDEAHNMGNAVEAKGSRGMKKPADKALAGVLLQDMLPNARVVYVSATGATEISNLSYASRLGLWGEGTPFASREDFVIKVGSGGVAAMELVAQNMKTLGLYTARSLSHEDVTHAQLEHVLTEDQRLIYNELARAWQVVLQDINSALGITERQNSQQKTAVLSAFWSTQQRFFNQVITAMQMPSVVKSIRKDIADGNAVVLQLVNTGEAAQKRASARMQEDDELEDLDLSPKDQLLEMVQASFPVQQYETYTDEHGNDASRPVVDAQGNPVLNADAVALRDDLLMRLASIRCPANPLDLLMQEFGTDKVAEVTGRTRRVVPDKSGKYVQEKWGSARSANDAKLFMDDKKQILVFSDAGGTGRSFHADMASKNQRKRIHYLIQPGWRADKAVQGMGRTHRSNEKSAPHYVLPTTDLKGQKRFISSIARRLDQLGALTKGQRQTGSQGIFQARDNLESTYAHDALRAFYNDLFSGKVEGVSLDSFEQQTGLKLTDKDGNINKNLPPIQQFLNRLLSMEIDEQNKVFDHFSRKMDELVQWAAEQGTLDVGMETIRGISIRKTSDQVVWTDEASGAETHYVQVEVENPADLTTWDKAKQYAEKFYQNNRSGKVWAASRERTRTDSDGRVLTVRTLVSVGSRQNVDKKDIGDPKKWTEIPEKNARVLWQEEYDSHPQTVTSTTHLVTGAILPLWDRLIGDAKIVRVQTDEGEKLLGRVVHPSDIDKTMRNLGVGRQKITRTGADVIQKALQGYTIRLSNKWKIKKKTVSGEDRVELIGPERSDFFRLQDMGVITERIDWNVRYFIPTGDQGGAILDRILKGKDIIAEEAPYTGPRLNDEGVTRLYAGFGPHELIDFINSKLGTGFSDKDIGAIRENIELPFWRAKEDPENFGKIFDNQQNRSLNRDLRRHDLINMLEPALRLQRNSKSWKKVGNALWHGDRLKKVLSEEALEKKFTPEEAAAYRAARGVLDYIWKEALPELMGRLDYTESEIEGYRRSRGNVTGYMPHPRRGKWHVKVENEEGKVAYREHFDDLVATLTSGKLSLKKAMKKPSILKDYPGKLVFGRNDKIPEDIFFSVSPQVTEELINMAMDRMPGNDIDKDVFRKALETTLADMFKTRGFMSHGIQRAGTPGFDKSNWQDAILQYISGYAGYESKLISALELRGLWGKLDWTDRPNARAYAEKYIKDSFANATLLDQTVDKARAFFFYKYLAANLKSAAIQLTQNAVTTWPVLSTETKWSGAKLAREMGLAARDILSAINTKPEEGLSRRLTATKNRISEDAWRGLSLAMKSGVVGDMLTQEIMGMNLGDYGTALRHFSDAVRFMFGQAEIFNRMTTWLTAYRIARDDKGMAEEPARKWADDIVMQTQFLYGKSNLPPFARGGNAAKVARSMYTFVSFAQNFLQLWAKLAKTAAGKRAIMRSIAALMVFGGLGGLPLFDTINRLIRKYWGKDLASEAKEQAGDYGDLLLYGVPGLVGVDLTGSLSIEAPRRLEDIFGVPWDFIKKGKLTADDIAAGDYYRAAEDFPLNWTAVSNPMAAYRYATRGQQTRSGKTIFDDEGNPVKLTTGEAIGKGLGFQPVKLSEGYRKFEARQGVEDYWADRKEKIKSKIVLAWSNRGDGSKQFKAAKEEVDRFNKEAPPFVAPINILETLRSRAVDRPSKRERALRDAVK